MQKGLYHGLAGVLADIKISHIKITRVTRHAGGLGAGSTSRCTFDVLPSSLLWHTGLWVGTFPLIRHSPADAAAPLLLPQIL
eukprot:1159385-Pelagomonas_calceolata.AAC.8